MNSKSASPDRRFADEAGRNIREVLEGNAEAIEEAGRAIAERLARGGRFLVFGCGHSGLAAQDVYYRAGGLMDLRCLFAPEVALDREPPEESSLAERRDDWIAARLPEGGLRPEDALVVISTSGLNVAPVAMASRAATAGSYLVAVGSPRIAESLPARHPSGRRLFELAAVTLDNGAPPGDTLVTLGDGVRMGSASTAASALLLQALTIAVREAARDRGLVLPVYVSGNQPGGLEENRRRRG